MKRFILVAAFVLLAVIIKLAGNSGKRDLLDRPVTAASELVGRWRAIESTEVRGFSEGGATWIETSASSPTWFDTSRRQGTFRFLERGAIEIQMEGEPAKIWKVSLSNDVLRMQPPDGPAIGYVDASKVPVHVEFKAKS
jgi:hypothetical protein